MTGTHLSTVKEIERAPRESEGEGDEERNEAAMRNREGGIHAERGRVDVRICGWAFFHHSSLNAQDTGLVAKACNLIRKSPKKSVSLHRQAVIAKQPESRAMVHSPDPRECQIQSACAGRSRPSHECHL